MLSKREKAKVNNQKGCKEEKGQKGPQVFFSKRESKGQREDQVKRQGSMDHMVMESESESKLESN